ncbi:hypothetical protein [Rhizobium leguminosarum]|uniref:hypothetical protein n=1 Tax=Rhizobium leguminosarum TaxID=384 RepID=UPI002E0E7FC5|nr:hypothetical protein U8Q02_41300 [Rhizobium leguminosarum]
MSGSGQIYLWPRNVKWASLPVVDRPVFDYGICTSHSYFVTENGDINSAFPPRQSDEKGASTIRRQRQQLRQMLPAVDHVVVLAHGCGDRLIWEAVAPVWSARSATFKVTLVTGGTNEIREELHLAEVARLERKFRGHDRFMMNYVFNMVAIGGRARCQAVTEAGLPSVNWHDGRLYNEDHLTGNRDDYILATPSVLPILRAFANASAPIRIEAADDYERLDFPRSLSLAPCFQRDGDGRLAFRWSGTGKHPPIELEVGRMHDAAFVLGQTDAGEQYAQAVAALSGTGFVAPLDGRMRITRQGRRLLELVGPEMDDPDVLLRWRADDGRIASEEDIPSCDRWLHGKFRALKRQVSHLSASPFSEPDVPMALPTRKLIIRGYKFDLEEVSEAERPALVERIRKISYPIPLSHRKMGLLHPNGRILVEAPTGIWIGFPIETMRLDQPLESRFDENVDASTWDGALDRLLSLVPPELKHVEPDGPRYLTTPVIDAELPKATLRHKLELTDGMRLAHLRYGRAVFIDDLDEWRLSGRLRALGLGIWRGLEEGLPQKTEGLWDFGGRGFSTCGIFLGRSVGLCGARRSEHDDERPLVQAPHVLDVGSMSPIDEPAFRDGDLSSLLATAEDRLWCFEGQSRRRLRPAFFDPETGVVSLGEHWQARDAQAANRVQRHC